MGENEEQSRGYGFLATGRQGLTKLEFGLSDRCTMHVCCCDAQERKSIVRLFVILERHFEAARGCFCSYRPGFSPPLHNARDSLRACDTAP